MAGLWPWTCTRLFPGLMFHLDQTLGVSGQPQSCPTLGVLPSIPAGCLAHGGIHGMWSPSMDGGSQKGLHHEWSLLSALIMTDPLGFACWEWDCCLTFMWGRVVSLGWRPVEQVWWRLRQGLCRPQRTLESGLAGHWAQSCPLPASLCSLSASLGGGTSHFHGTTGTSPKVCSWDFFTLMNFTWES